MACLAPRCLYNAQGALRLSRVNEQCPYFETDRYYQPNPMGSINNMDESQPCALGEMNARCAERRKGSNEIDCQPGTLMPDKG
jgi:hypothetical protein